MWFIKKDALKGCFRLHCQCSLLRRDLKKSGLKASQPISRVLSRTIIHLQPASPQAVKRPTRIHCEQQKRIPIWPCSEWGLHCHKLLPDARCALTAPFHPYLTNSKK